MSTGAKIAPALTMRLLRRAGLSRPADVQSEDRRLATRTYTLHGRGDKECRPSHLGAPFDAALSGGLALWNPHS